MEEEYTNTSDNNKKTKEVDLRDHRVDSIVNVVPLEPCIVWAAISEKKNEESAYRSIGIPGFYDPQTKKFITLDGGRVTIEGFSEQLEKYIQELDKKIMSQHNVLEQNSNG